MKTPPNRLKIAFVVLVISEFCTIGYFAIQLFDQSATLDMLRDHDKRIEAALSTLRTAMPEALRISGRASQNDILTILQKHYPTARIVSRPSTIEMDEIRFCFALDGSLDRIERTDDYGTSASDSPTNRDTIHQ
jgi:hypothetical protein